MVKNYEHPRRDKNNYIQEHILVMEQKIGRYLDYKREEVHHINGNRVDNRIENLKLMSKSEHARLSRLEDSKEVWEKRRRAGWFG